MKKFDYEVTNALGIHARPAAMLAQVCTNHKVTVEIECNGEIASGNNVLQILDLHASIGSCLHFSVDGLEEDACINEIEKVLKEIDVKNKKTSVLRGGTHKTVLEMFSGNGVACGLCRFSILQVIQ